MSENVKDTAKTEEPVNPALIIAELIDCKANTKLENLSGNSFCQLIYNAFIDIFMKYSDHKEMYPSFKGFSVNEYELLNEGKYIKLNAFNNDFKIIITKIPQEYDVLQNMNTRYDIRVEDNFVSVSVGSVENKSTTCELIPIMIPFAFLDATSAITSPANGETYKDLHDTILGFNLLMMPICCSETKCLGSDVFNFDKGFDISYKHALLKKIKLDIDNEKTAAKYYNECSNRYKVKAMRAMRTLRRCKKSMVKISRELHNK